MYYWILNIFCEKIFFLWLIFQDQIMNFTFNLIFDLLSQPIPVNEEVHIIPQTFLRMKPWKMRWTLMNLWPKTHENSWKFLSKIKFEKKQPISGRHLHDSVLRENDSAKVEKLFWPLSVPRSSSRSNLT